MKKVFKHFFFGFREFSSEKNEFDFFPNFETKKENFVCKKNLSEKKGANKKRKKSKSN